MCTDLERLSSEVEFVEHNELGTPPTDHIAGRTAEVDYQVWIASDNLPRRIVITYKNAPGQPQFWANLSDWNLAPQMSRDAFTFVPPSGAEQIPTLLPPGKTDSARVRGGT